MMMSMSMKVTPFALLMLSAAVVEGSDAAGCTFQPHCDYGKGEKAIDQIGSLPCLRIVS